MDFEQIGEYNILSKESFLDKKNEDFCKYTFIPLAVCFDELLTPFDAYVFGFLMTHVQKSGGGNCFPSASCLAKECKSSISSINKALSNLKKACWIDWVNTGRGRIFAIYRIKDHDKKMEQIRDTIKIKPKISLIKSEKRHMLI